MKETSFLTDFDKTCEERTCYSGRLVTKKVYFHSYFKNKDDWTAISLFITIIFFFIYSVHPHVHISGKGSPIFFFLSTNNNLQNRYKNDEITNKGKSCRLAHSATFQSQKVSVQDFVSHESDCLNYRWKIRISPGSTSKFLTRRPHSSFSRVQLLEGPPRTWRICFKYMDAFGPIDSWEST